MQAPKQIKSNGYTYTVIQPYGGKASRQLQEAFKKHEEDGDVLFLVAESSELMSALEEWYGDLLFTMNGDGRLQPYHRAAYGWSSAMSKAAVAALHKRVRESNRRANEKLKKFMETYEEDFFWCVWSPKKAA